MPARFLGCAPVLLVRDVKASAAFWETRLGFDAKLFHQPPTFAIVTRGEAKLMLAQLPFGATPAVPNWKIAKSTNQAYIWVDDCATFFAEAHTRGAPIDFTLYDTPWGTREFGTQDLDGFDITFGQVLATDSDSSSS